MITWLLLMLLFSEGLQNKNGGESGIPQCGPLNLKVTHSDRTILSTWEDNPSCSAVSDALIYEVVVLTDQKDYQDEVVVMPEQIGSTHTWNWTSTLPLECVSNTVKIRSRYDNNTSPWMQEILPSSEPGVYPKDRRVAVNSTVTFCCILPPGEALTSLFLTGYNSSKVTKISRQAHALTVLLDKPSKNTCTDVICSSLQKRRGACAWIGYPPGDTDLQCETQDFESVDCYWTAGPEARLPPNKISTKYQLNGRNCAASSKKKCSLKVKVEAGERNWTLTAQNELGKVELTDRVDLMKRVHMITPGDMAVVANARNINVLWKWKVQRYNDLDVTCQINVSHGETSVMSEASGVRLRSGIVAGLTPNCEYNVTVRCRTTHHQWKWSDWSPSFSFRTEGDVPDALDVWTQTKDNQTFIMWKELQANQSHGDILSFEVSWAKTTEPELRNTTLIENNGHNVSLSLDLIEEYIVNVTARNNHGNSLPSTIIVPSIKPDRTTVNIYRISGSNGGFNLSWSASHGASCGYIVDWCPTSGSYGVKWLKVSQNQTNARIESNFKDGQRYLLSVYACTHRAPVLLQRGEGYIKEQRMGDNIFGLLNWKQQDSNVEIFWKPVHLSSHSAFIVGYVLYCEDTVNNKIVCNVSTDDPKATSLTAKNLTINTYTFTVKAKTAVGECGATSITASLDPLTDDVIVIITISLASVFVLFCLVIILCYRSWSCIKYKVYPPIPEPVLTDKWLSMGDNHQFHVDQYLHSEADIMDVPELQCKQGALVNDYMIQDNLPYVSAQPLKSYYNQCVKSGIPQPLSLPTTTISLQSGLPPALVKNLIPNPSYNLTMEMEYQPWSPEPEVGVNSEPRCDGYKPQSQVANLFVNQTDECTDSPSSCVFTYVLLPQLPNA